jgi:hypothetical protein
MSKEPQLLAIPTVGEILLEEFLKLLGLSQNALRHSRGTASFREEAACDTAEGGMMAKTADHRALQYFELSIFVLLVMSVCSGTALSYSKSSEFAAFGDWKIRSESGVLGFMCRAAGQVNEFEIQILASDLTPRYAPFAVVVRTPKNTKQFLPVNFRTNAKMFVNDEYSAEGEIIISGDVVGGKIAANYARATFGNIKDGRAKLRKAHKLTLIAEDKKFVAQEIMLQDMEQIISLLQKCQEARGSKK